MKIAVTSREPSMDAEVDPRFGRACAFVIFDTETGDHEILDNTQNVNAAHGAGIQAAAKVADAGASYVLTGDCGPKATRTLDEAGVKMILGVEGGVRDAIARFQAGDFTA